MKLKTGRLMKLNIPYAIEGSEIYFDVLEIKKLFPNKKFPPNKIKKFPIGGIYTNTIKAEDVEDMTEFDKNVLQFMKTKPK